MPAGNQEERALITDLESRKSEVALQIVSIAEEPGLPTPKVEYMRFQDERVPKLWREESGDFGFNDAFSNCSDSEIRFAAIYIFHPMQHTVFPRWKMVCLIASVLLLFVTIFAFNLKGPLVILIPNSIVFWFVFAEDSKNSKQMAAHLERVISLAGDSIAARTYMERVYGRVIPRGFFEISRRNRTDNPIFKYLRHGKDEKLKAILKSDMVHPIQGRSES